MPLNNPYSSISKESILKIATQTLGLEADAINRLAENLDDNFVAVVSLILNSTGRVVITGVGKSADVGRKIVATLNSTGSPALFVHSGDAVHGDLGVIQTGDVVICLSKSGRSAEIMALAPLLKQQGHPVIGVTGVADSPLAKQSDYVLIAGVDPEACPFDLAPTTSTAVQMALGDALALCLMEARGFGAEDFAKFHPGGALGKRLTVKLDDLRDSGRKPNVGMESPLQDVLMSMTEGRYGATVVLGDDSSIKGIITDGDLRRSLANGTATDSKASEIMSSEPLTVNGSELAAQVAGVFQEKGISQIIVTDEMGKYSGMVHLHDLVKEGIIQVTTK
ncbi:MAG: D-arabinose 5-phosphate isomerase [Bacteroidetes bacterium]|nr:MAG: D-arabinose 5-phosphate isomerase [Bacteroidota bacterium]